MLGRVKRWLLAMLAASLRSRLRVAPVPPPRGGAFDPSCASWPQEGVGTKGVPRDRPPGGFDSPAARRTKGMTKRAGEASWSATGRASTGWPARKLWLCQWSD